MIYTIILFFLLLISLIYVNGNNENCYRDKRYIQVVFFVLWILSALRYQEGFSDFRNNIIGMINIRDIEFKDLLFQSEFLHQLLRKVISVLFTDPQWYFIVTSLIINVAVMFFGYRYIMNLPVYILMYYCVFYYFTFNNITRQGISVALVLFGYIFLLKNRKSLYLLFLLMAVFVHRSAFIAILALLFMKVKVTKRIILGYLLAFIILVAANRPITAIGIKYIYTDYVSGYGIETASQLYYAYAVIAFFIVVYFISLINLDNNKEILYRSRYYELESIGMENISAFIANGTMMYVACITLSCMNMLMYARVALYFIPCFALCIDQVLQRSSRNNRRIILFLLFLFSVAVFAVMNMNGKLVPTPYKFFWMIENRLK